VSPFDQHKEYKFSGVSHLLRDGVRFLLSRQFQRMRRTWNFYQRESGLPGYYPRGDFNSPLPDISEGQRIATTAFNKLADRIPGIDLRVDAQQRLLLRMVDVYPEFDWSEHRVPGRRFHFAQDWYAQADGICLYSMLRLFRPRRVVEVGSGFTSALMLDVNDRFLGRHTQLTFVDPYPDRLDLVLSSNDRRQVRIIRKRVQDAPKEIFTELENGDFLFIDSSHVSKVGSDVNFLFFEVLPNLPIGVFVHFHDVFWPFEYPAKWIAEGRSWNEAYLLRSFLTFNNSFEIVFWVPLAALRWRDIIKERMPTYLIDTGAAIWIRRAR
jgi:predicted O-methyltransferase YrrM